MLYRKVGSRTWLGAYNAQQDDVLYKASWQEPLAVSSPPSLQSAQWLRASFCDPHLRSPLLSTDLENYGPWGDAYLSCSDIRVCDFTRQKRVKSTAKVDHVTDQRIAQ